MTSKRSKLESECARALLPLGRLWRQAADRALGGMGVSAAAGWALVQIGRLGDEVRPTDLARETDVTGASLARLLESMTAGELIVRHPDPVDRRVSRVRLTGKGRALVSEIEAALAALRREMLAGVSDDDLASAVLVAHHLEAAFGRRRGA